MPELLSDASERGYNVASGNGNDSVPGTHVLHRMRQATQSRLHKKRDVARSRPYDMAPSGESAIGRGQVPQLAMPLMRDAHRHVTGARYEVKVHRVFPN